MHNIPGTSFPINTIVEDGAGHNSVSITSVEKKGDNAVLENNVDSTNKFTYFKIHLFTH